jgi:Domain of unknown function (DUF1707)
MASDSRIRGSDADRDRTAAALREHLAAGRVTTEEFEERLDTAYATKTLGELDELMADLPGTDLEAASGCIAAPRRCQFAAAGARSPQVNGGQAGQVLAGVAGGLGSWLAISLLLLAIWLASGASGGLWLLWVALPLGALLLGHWVTGAPGRGERRPARRDHRHRGSDGGPGSNCAAGPLMMAQGP